MIDFTKYTLQELQAVVEVLDWLTDDMSSMSDEMGMLLALAYYGAASMSEARLVKQQARAAGEAPAAAGEAPAAADPPALLDMFGWVGDALDDLCAAGEVIGK